jgi:hypothetical protein
MLNSGESVLRISFAIRNTQRNKTLSLRLDRASAAYLSFIIRIMNTTENWASSVITNNKYHLYTVSWLIFPVLFAIFCSKTRIWQNIFPQVFNILTSKRCILLVWQTLLPHKQSDAWCILEEEMILDVDLYICISHTSDIAVDTNVQPNLWTYISCQT